jgi:small subunit ribosomal protein S8
MSMTDPISDMLTRIRNAQTARKPSVTLPMSKQKLAVAKVLEQEGYLASVKSGNVEGKNFMTLELKY